MRPLLSIALAAAVAAPSFAQTQSAAAMVPGQANAAAFVNVGKILEDYGMLFDGGPFAEQLEQFIAMGLPDPRTEGLRQLAIGGTFDSLDTDTGVVMITRDPGAGAQPELAKRVVDFGVAAGMIESAQSAYRGVTLHGVSQPGGPQELQAADVNEYDVLASFSKSADHDYAKLAIDTIQGANPSFEEKYGTQLAADQYAALSFEMPKELREQLEQSQLAFLSLIGHARAELAARDGEIRLSLDGVCADDFDAEALKRSLEKAFAKLREQIPGGDEFGPILDSVQFSREGDTATVSLALPEDFVKELLADFTGAELPEEAAE